MPTNRIEEAAVVGTRAQARFRWRCSRCARDCDEPVRDGWGSTYALCSCGQPVELEVKRDLDGRVLSVMPREPRPTR